MANQTETANAASSGVESLIERLRDEGVARGREEAERITSDAQHRANWIIEQAEEEAALIREKARTESTQLRKGGEEALQVAARDAVLQLKSFLAERFANEVRRVVGKELRDEAFLQQLILEVAGRVRDDAALERGGPTELLLPRDVIGLDELRRHPEALKEGTLSYFVLELAGQMLREGVTFQVAGDGSAGLRIRLTEQDVEIELTERAVAELLLHHLQPRFRAFLEGMVK